MKRSERMGNEPSNKPANRAKQEAIFWVTNHHGAQSGNPPHVDGTAPDRYCGYFQNEHGEQAIFIYDYKTRTGTLLMGDYDWEKPVSVIDGLALELNLSQAERLWLQACWNAATAFQRE